MRMKPLRAVGLAAVLAIAGSLGFTAPGRATGAPGAVQVTIKNFDFQPMAVSVPVGGSVSWKNLDGEPHTVTSTDGSFRSEALDQNDVYTFKFAKPGVYSYICTIHPKMRATVTVK